MTYDYFVRAEYAVEGTVTRKSFTVSFAFELNTYNFEELRSQASAFLANLHDLDPASIARRLHIEQVHLLNVGEVYAFKNTEKNEVIARMQKAYDDLLQENAELRERNKQISVEAAAQGWWAWQPQGPNDLDTLTCPVLISAYDLRQILLEFDSHEYFINPVVNSNAAAYQREFEGEKL